jgi:hypothetical protein
MNLLKRDAVIDSADAGLKFTDILFGFVIFQLFLRLEAFGSLPWYLRWQLIAGVTLVLGSWIGFRFSLTRPSYRLRFFNLPFFRFALDQVMVILYFRIAVLIPNPLKGKVDPSNLAHTTVVTIMIVFWLYVAWDALGVLMASRVENVQGFRLCRDRSDDHNDYKYGRIKEMYVAPDENTHEQFGRYWGRGAISVVFAVLFLVLYVVTNDRHLSAGDADVVFAVSVGLMLAYRFFKDAGTSKVESRASQG